jgi:hypothetical protein
MQTRTNGHFWRKAAASAPGAVIERQHDLVIPKRQRLWKAFQADPRGGGGIDAEDARGAERSLARTVRCVGRRAPRHRSDEGNPKDVHGLKGLYLPLHLTHCVRCCRLDNA